MLYERFFYILGTYVAKVRSTDFSDHVDEPSSKNALQVRMARLIHNALFCLSTAKLEASPKWLKCHQDKRVGEDQSSTSIGEMNAMKERRETEH